jgi:hypothetical protein
MPNPGAPSLSQIFGNTPTNTRPSLAQIFGNQSQPQQNQSSTNLGNSQPNNSTSPDLSQQNQSQDPNSNAPENSWSPGSQYGSAAAGFGKVGSWLWQNVAQPTASFVAGAPVTALKDIQGAGMALQDIPAAIQQGGLQNWNKPLNVPNSVQQIGQTVASPVNVPGLGNINMNAANPKPSLEQIFQDPSSINPNSGQFDPMQSMKNIIGKGAQTLATVGAFGSPIGGIAADAAPEEIAAANAATAKAAVPWAGKIGALGGFGGTIQNPNASATDVAGSTLLGGLTGSLFQGVLGKIFGSGAPAQSLENMTDKQIENAAAGIGLPKNVTAMLKTMTPEEAAQQAAFQIQAGQHVLTPDDPTTPSPVQSLASDVTNGVKKLFGIQQQVGSAIGAAKQAIVDGTPVAVDPTALGQVQNDFVNSLKGLFAKISPADTENGEAGAIDFSKSSIKNLPADQKLLQQGWQEINNASTTGDLIQARDTLNQTMNYGRANQQISSSEALIKNLLYGNDGNGGITGLIHDAHPELQQLDDTYSELKPVISTFQKVAGGKTELTGNEPIDGTNTFNLLRRSLGAGNADNSAIVGKLEQYGQQYGIPELQNIVKQTRMAQTAEDLANTDVQTRPTGFSGRSAQALKSGTKVGGKLLTGNIGEAGLEGAHALMEMAPKKSVEQTFLKLLQGAQKPEDLGMGTSATQFLKLLLPSISGLGGGGIGTGVTEGLSPNFDPTIQAVSGLGGSAIGNGLMNPQNQNS